MPGSNDVRDPVGNDACFTAAGARQDEQRSFSARDRFTLLGVQALEKIHGWGQFECSRLTPRRLAGRDGHPQGRSGPRRNEQRSDYHHQQDHDSH